MNNGRICVSVCAETTEEMIANIKRAEEFADVTEVRFDCLNPDQVETLKSAISDLKFEIPLIATFRSLEQGGKSAVSIDERAQFWRSNRHIFWAGDFEEDVLHVSHGYETRIASFHDFGGVPPNLDLIVATLSASDTNIIKIAVATDDICNTIPVWKLLARAKAENREIIPISMGEAGKWTRILGLAHGAYLTYASLDTGAETAPGQITAKDMVEIYRVKELDQDTKVFGVIGDPVSESLSPYMHNPAFVNAGINTVFIPFLVKNIDEFMRRMVKADTREVELNFGGFSVTMPHKQTIIKHLDTLHPTARKISAVNTVKIEDDGKLTGYNTDAHGFITPLKEKFGDLRDARVAVLGAGGAARACVYALKQENADVTVFGRDEKKTKLFADEFGLKWLGISNFKFQISNSLSDDFDIIVNATPLGMTGALESETLLTSEQLKGVKFVYDLVTKSSGTPLIREAKVAGIPAMGGIEMLIAQGAKQFEIWTGRAAPVEIMRTSLLARMHR